MIPESRLNEIRAVLAVNQDACSDLARELLAAYERERGLLDWLEAHGDGSQWVCRQSITGRGWRLHETQRADGKPTIREAIQAAMKPEPTRRFMTLHACPAVDYEDTAPEART